MNTNYLVVGVAAVVIGLAIASVAWLQIVPYQEDRKNAATVDATVIAAGVTEGQNAEAQTVYAPNVTYRYTYEGTDYTSSSVFPGTGDVVNSESRAQEIVDRFAPGKEVTAYVNTANPNSAFLIDEQAPLWYWAGPIIGGLLILYGVYATVLGVRGVEPASADF